MASEWNFLQLFISQNGDDEQDGVRAPFDGFKNLALINDEIFSQQGNFYGGADLAEIIERALEKLFIGQNGKAAAPAASYSFAIFTGSKSLQMIPADGEAFLTSAINAMSPRGFFSAAKKITPLAMLQHCVAQIAGGDDARGQFRDFVFFFVRQFYRECSRLIFTAETPGAQSFIFSASPRLGG